MASYPTLQPNFGSNFDDYDQSQLQLASLAFAQEDTQIELEEEIEIEEEEIEEEETEEEEEEEDLMEDAADAIADANEEIEKADEKIAEATDKGKETTLAQEQLNEAILQLEIAQASFDSGDFEEAEELAEEAEDLASEARGKLIGKTEADLEDEGEEGDEEEAEDEEEEEIEIEVEVEDGVAKVKVEFNDQKHRFLVTDDTSEDAIADAILALPGFPSEINPMDIWDFEVEEEEDESDSKSTTTTQFNEWEAEQQAQELYHDLLEKINELEERIQALLEKYESGEYYGNVPEVDSEIKSYTISFTGSATSKDDDSISSPVEGTIYIDTLMTGQHTSKYIVTGGEISIDDTFYEFIFGKVRVSSGNMIIIGQVLDWAGDDDSSTIKLVIQSDVPLGGDFGSEPIDIEILPQSKIAGQWYLSGPGSLSII